MGDDESQIIELLEHKIKCINTIHEGWVTEWASLTEKYFKLETRSHVRLKAMALLSQTFSKYHVVCEDELINKVILPNFGDADQENDSVVRKPIVHLLFDVASTCLSYKNCNAILAILKRILNKPYRQRSDESTYMIGNVDIIDSRLIISSLSKLFKTKLHRLPIDPAVNMLDISVNYLHLTYKHTLKDPTPAEIPMIRRELFSLFLNLRCNKYGHLGVLSPNQSENSLRYSPFIICVKRPKQSQTDQQPQQQSQCSSPTQLNSTNTNQFTLNSPTHQQSQQQLHYHHHHHHHHHQHQHQQQNHHQPQQIHSNIFVSSASQPNCPLVSRCVNLDAMIGGIIDCINLEPDSDVLKLVLDGLPGLLANKYLISTVTDERVNQLCLALGDLIRQSKSSRSGLDIKSSLRSLTSLLIYRRILDHKSIKVMLSAFEDSLKASLFPVVPLFTTCLIELQDSSEMTKFLPVVLNRLSKFSPTIHLGISMLEFLSYLILFPKLYENFSEDEYKFIFAIALPYTNSSRFGEFITCLAFRVVAMWYLNCRPLLRCAFVEFVKKSLQSNVIQPFKENPSNIHSQTSSPVTQTPPLTYSCPPTMSPVDQRKRSLSLNTENCFKNQHGVLGLQSVQSPLQVNEELIETFADLLSRYTHGQWLAIAPNNKCVERLVDRTTSQTWLHGNSLVTITSGHSSYGWAEIMIRRPTGNTSWIGRLQNTLGTLPIFNQQVYLESLNFGNDVISLFSTMSLNEDLQEDALADSHICSSTASLITNSSGINTPSPLSLVCSTQPLRFKDPILLPKDNKLDKTLSNFDHITPYETHKVGVIYVAKNQADSRQAIFSNKYGSLRYYEFLGHMGTCITLNEIDPEIYFIGGLDVKGDDGKYAYFWKDNVTQVIFHVATFMPTRGNDPHCNNKNRHIGNDHVCLVYNDSGQSFQLSTIKGTGQFIKACIVVSPLDGATNLVEAEVLPDLATIVRDIEPKVLSNLGAALYARQLAIHLNLASKIFDRRREQMCGEPYVSNWVERLRCIKRIRQRLDDNQRKVTTTPSTLSRLPTAIK